MPDYLLMFIFEAKLNLGLKKIYCVSGNPTLHIGTGRP